VTTATTGSVPTVTDPAGTSIRDAMLSTMGPLFADPAVLQVPECDIGTASR